MEPDELKNALDDIRTKATAAAELKTDLSQLDERISSIEAAANRIPRPRGRASDEAETKFIQFMKSGQGLEQKDLQIGVDRDGGFTIPLQIERLIQDQLLEISPMRSLADVVATETSNYRKLVNVRGTTSGWVGEIDTRTPTNTPELEPVNPTPGEVYAYPSVTRWVLEDSAFNLQSWLRDNVAAEFALQEGAAFVTGDGVNKPTGFLTNPTAATADDVRAFGALQYVATGASGAFSSNPFDDVVDLMTSLRPSYRQGAAFVMNTSTAAVLRKAKDSNGAYLWQDNVAAGQPPTMLGFPVVEDEEMPDIAADSFSVAFGNWRRGYIIADRAGLTFVRDEVTQPGWIKFYSAKRVGGSTADTNAIKLLKFGTS